MSDSILRTDFESWSNVYFSQKLSDKVLPFCHVTPSVTNWSPLSNLSSPFPLEILDCYAVLSKEDLVEGEVTLSFLNTLDQERSSFSLSLDPEAIIDDGEDDSVFKLAAKENIAHLNRLKIHNIVAEGIFILN